MSFAAKTLAISRATVIAARRGNGLIGPVNAITEDNRRWAPRRASETLATLFGTELGDPVPCVVLDTSSTGVRVRPHLSRTGRCQTLKDLPAKFAIMFTVERVAIDCVVAWRNGSEVGLKFISPARSVPKPQRLVIGKNRK